MERLITGFHRDEAGDWVADLDCGHTRHVRNRPPFWNRPWVESSEGRTQWVGRPLDCKKCEESQDAKPRP